MSLIVGLVIFALLLFALELFLPGGVLGFTGTIFLLIACGYTFVEYGPLPAALLLLAGTAVTVGLVMIELRLFSSSPLSRLLSLDTAVDASTEPTPTQELSGQQGVTLTTMAPTGTVRVGDSTYTASSLDGYLSKNTPVTVVRAEPYKLVVKKQWNP